MHVHVHVHVYVCVCLLIEWNIIVTRQAKRVKSNKISNSIFSKMYMYHCKHHQLHVGVLVLYCDIQLLHVSYMAVQISIVENGVRRILNNAGIDYRLIENRYRFKILKRQSI